ncbi:hypothetical protein LTS06_012832, partial [Exophiala xenobiotica]
MSEVLGRPPSVSLVHTAVPLDLLEADPNADGPGGMQFAAYKFCANARHTMLISSVVSVAEFASKSFGPGSLSTRLGPKEYKMVPEAILNAVLKDIHNLTQFAVVQVR